MEQTLNTDSSKICPICGTPMHPYMETEEALYTNCPACDYLRAWPDQVKSLSLNVDIYSERTDGQLEVARVPTRRQARKYAKFVRSVEKYRSMNRFLDLGCGAGKLVECAAQLGWDAWGTDPAMRQASVQISKGNIHILAKTLERCGFEDGFFDVVHANEVLEHVEHIPVLIGEIARILRPGGIFIFRTPNYRSWTAKMSGPRWRMYSVFGAGHVSFLSRQAVNRVFAQNNLVIRKCYSFRFTLKDRWPNTGRLRKAFLSGIARPISMLARLFNRGQRLTIWGEKSERAKPKGSPCHGREA